MIRTQSANIESIKKQALKRRKASMLCVDDFLAFVRFTMPSIADPEDIENSRFQVSRHHKVIAQALTEVENGNIKRLMVTLPPQHGKSELISRRFTSWLMGKDPRNDIIFATYNEDFAHDFGSDVRAIILSLRGLTVELAKW